MALYIIDVPTVTDEARADYNLLMAKAMLERNRTEQAVITDDRIRWQKVGGNIIETKELRSCLY